MQNLVETQCGGSNALVSLSKHFTHDKARRDDGMHKLPYDAIHQDPHVQEFMREAQEAISQPVQPFNMNLLMQEMREIESAKELPIRAPAVADLAHRAATGSHLLENAVWNSLSEENASGGVDVFGIDDASCYVSANQSYHHAPMNIMHHPYPQPPQLQFGNPMMMNHPMNYGAYTPMQAPRGIHPMTENSNGSYTPLETLHENSVLSSPNSKETELAKTANELLSSVDEPNLSNTDFMHYIRQLGESAQGEEKEKQQNSTGTYVDVDSSEMSPKDREKFWDNFQEKLMEMSRQEDAVINYPWLSSDSEDLSGPFKEYQLTPDNPNLSHPDPLTEGERCLSEGDFPSAALLFEAAVTQEPQNSKAWYLLGHTLAGNEQDERAIPALRKCVELSPKHSEAWMSLATSYTNESYQTLACQALKEWLFSKEEYSHLVKDTSIDQHKPFCSTLAPKELINEIECMFISAANLRPETADADIQCGLGVLLSATGDYDKAVDCFNTALAARPQDSQLWNKLGATLANSNKPMEAVAAYKKALSLNPGYMRCRYNLGIAFINLQSYGEAAESLLSVLNFQAANRGVSEVSSVVSDNVWSTFRLCLPPLQKTNLLKTLDKRDLETLNKEFGTSDS